MSELNEALINAISAEIKIKRPKATSDEIIDYSKTVIDIFEKITGEIMRLEDVSKEVVDFCLKMSEKSTNFSVTKESIINSVDAVILSINKLIDGLRSLNKGFNSISMPTNVILKELNKNKISNRPDINEYEMKTINKAAHPYLTKIMKQIGKNLYDTIITYIIKGPSLTDFNIFKGVSELIKESLIDSFNIHFRKDKNEYAKVYKASPPDNTLDELFMSSKEEDYRIAKVYKASPPDNTLDKLFMSSKEEDYRIIDYSKTVIDIFEKITDGIMRLEDVSKEVVDFCLKMSEKSTNFSVTKESIINSIDAVILSINKLIDGLGSLNKGFNSISMPTNVILKELNKNKISNNISKFQSINIGNLFDIIKGSINTSKNFIKIIFNNISSFVNNIINTITNPFKKIGSIIMAPFSYIDSLIKSPFKDLISIKDKIVNKYNQTKDFLTGSLSSGPNKRSTEEDYRIAGITSRSISENLVLRRSAVGVAVFWLYKKIVQSRTRLINGNSGDSGWLDNLADTYLVGNAIKNLLKGRVLKLAMSAATLIYGTGLIGAGSLIAYLLGKSRINALERRGETPESILGVKKATRFQKAIVYGSEAIAGDVGKGSFKERTFNAIKNAGWGGSIGALIGGGLGALTGPAGIVAGAMLGSKLGIAIGASTGFAGGKDLANGINALSNLSKTIKKLFTASPAYADELNNKKTFESTKKVTENLSSYSGAVIKSTDNIKEFNKKISETNKKVLPSFWDSLKEFFFGFIGKINIFKSTKTNENSSSFFESIKSFFKSKDNNNTSQLDNNGLIKVDPVDLFIKESISKNTGKTKPLVDPDSLKDSINIRDRFMSVVRSVISNPYALAAIEATGARETAWKRSRMTSDWDDLGERSGGIMSWRGPRLEALRAFAKKHNLSLESPETHALYFLHEQRGILNDLNSVKTPEDAARIMANAWRFAGYKGGPELYARIKLTKEYAKKYTDLNSDVVKSSVIKPDTSNKKTNSINITETTKKIQENNRSRVINQQEMSIKIAEQLSNLNQNINKSISISENQKQNNRSDSNNIKVASDIHNVPKYIMEMVFGLHQGSENGRLGIV